MRRTVPVLLSAMLCLSTASMAASPDEEGYWATRDAYIAKLKGAGGKPADKAGLADLEKRLQKLIGPVNVQGFPREGKINLETLDSDADIGFGQADGLAFRGNAESLFVTTRNLLKSSEADLPALVSPSLYARAFSSDAAVEFYAEIPVKSADGKSPARAHLGMIAQDTGPFPPSTIFVFVPKGGRIFLVAADTKLPQLAACAKWDRDFGRYVECYIAEAKKQGLFASVQKQAQSIVDRLQKD